METLHQRLAMPHPPVLFPCAIADMNREEQESEALECAFALFINIWQTTAQKEEVRARLEGLKAVLSEPPEQPFLDAPLNGNSGFSLLK